MNPLLDPDARLVIAHRGSSSEAPENTLPAFEAAVRRGADAIELDVRLTADGAPVVIHDATLDRTTDRTGPVAALTLAELRAVDAGWHFTPDQGRTNPCRGSDVRIPTLGEVLWAFPRLSILVEIKEPSAQEAVRRVLVQEDATARCVVASEHREALVAFDEPPFVRGASAPRDLGTLLGGAAPAPRTGAGLSDALGPAATPRAAGADAAGSSPPRGRTAARCTCGRWTPRTPRADCGAAVSRGSSPTFRGRWWRRGGHCTLNEVKGTIASMAPFAALRVTVRYRSIGSRTALPHSVHDPS